MDVTEKVSDLATTNVYGNGTEVYCGKEWSDFWSVYDSSFDNPLLVILSLVGTVGNILNLVVFLQKNMRNPTINLLTALSIADLLCVVRKLQWLILNYAHSSYTGGWQSHSLILTRFVNACLIFLFHSASVYLTLAVAIWRYLMVLKPLKSRSWATSRNAKWTIFVAIVFTTAVSLGSFINHRFSIVKKKGYELAVDEESEYFLDRHEIYSKFALIVYGILIKLVPCLIILFVSVGILRSLLNARKNRARLVKAGTIFYKLPVVNSPSNTIPDGGELGYKMAGPEPRRASVGEVTRKLSKSSGGGMSRNLDSEFDRTTSMLLIVLIIFLMTELPAGVAMFLTGIFETLSHEIFMQCYLPMLNFIQMSEYVSSSTSFFVYVTTSYQFRMILLKSFYSLILCICPRLKERELIQVVNQPRNPVGRPNTNGYKNPNLNPNKSQGLSL